jgi:predicted lipoprotein
MIKTKNSDMREIALSVSQVLIVRAYRRLKQVEKHLADKLARAKARLLELAGNDSAVLLEGEKKIASIGLQDGKTTLDVLALKQAFPQIDFSRFEKRGESFLVVRLH